MKLKEGIKKEDLLECYFICKDSNEAGSLCILLGELGYTVESGYSWKYLTCICYQNIQTGAYNYEFVDAEFLDRWTKKTLSDLIEDEQSKYVRCVRSDGADELTHNRVYKIDPAKKPTDEGMFFVFNDQGGSSCFYKSRFVPAAEEEYLAHQASLNPLAQVDEELDQLKKNMMQREPVLRKEVEEASNITWYQEEDKEQVFSITDSQVKEIVDKVIEYGYADSLLMDKLKEWFPSVSVFKTEDKKEIYYSVGQRFKFHTGEEYLLARTDTREINMFSIKTGNRWGSSMKVPNVHKITQKEFGQFVEYRVDDFTLIQEA